MNEDLIWNQAVVAAANLAQKQGDLDLCWLIMSLLRKN